VAKLLRNSIMTRRILMNCFWNY